MKQDGNDGAKRQIRYKMSEIKKGFEFGRERKSKAKVANNFEFPEILFPLNRIREGDLISLIRIVPHPRNKGKNNPKR